MKKTRLFYPFLLGILLIGSLGWFSLRFDWTSEKRYTLSEASVKVLKTIQKPLLVEVYLEGDFPADFKQLQRETEFMLGEFRKINPKIDYKLIDPIKNKIAQDTLMAMGMEPSILPDLKDGKIQQIVVFPYAVIKYDGYGTSVPLILQQSGMSRTEQMTRSIENLEYALISNLRAITIEERKNIGILVNHDELKPTEFQVFMQMALENYNVGPVIPNQKGELTMDDVPNLKRFDALVIAKPRKPFTDGEKVILDQYIMNGGKTLWMLDAVNAEMDTLFHAKKIMAYPVDLNLTDFLFNYGVRLNPGLVKDFKKSALIRLATGEVAGNPQYSSFIWPYFPLGIAEKQHAITRNINPVKLEFPTSIDTLKRPGIQTKVLYESSDRTAVKTVPNYISLSEIVRLDSLGEAERPTPPKIFAVALEGKFPSAYAQRSEKTTVPNFRAQSPENKMIVIADGDVARNQVLKGAPLPLGEDLLTNQKYGNEQFLRNALDYLLDDQNLISLRNRNIEARLLDRQRIGEERRYWQFFNLLLPLGILAVLGTFFYGLRKRKFAPPRKK
ncbi:gliding motility-associated ABC transporter substrate-binding protein GldG [Bergeyella sp. RCAD1439]|uniref:gliding motility-associated ABC transporter substrate-binding protein GldG n=1 Tax=Bergeyella anatis TaxID=3113737 RepID=UPI002E197C90|nr:gliding motility-associated ABC transporter substrate-binding protein GldG [Bergeyella sp. RCAD1439]